MADNPFDQFDAPPAPQPASAPQTAPQPATAPTSASGNPFDQFDSKPAQAPQSPSPAPQAPPAAGPNADPTQGSGSDLEKHIAVVRSILGNPHLSNEDARQKIMDYAAQTGLAGYGTAFSDGIDQALSYRKRAGPAAAAHNTQFENMAGTQAQPSATNEPKPRPNGMSRPEALTIGALESVPGADRIGAGVQAGFDFLNPFSNESLSSSYDRELAQNRALSDQAASEHPGDYYPGMVAGMLPQLLIGTGEAGLAAEAPSLLGTVARGAGQAGLYSVADTRQDLTTPQGIEAAGKQAVVDSAVGGALGAATHGLASVVTSRGSAAADRAAQGQEVLDAGNRLNVEVPPALVGGKVVRGASTVAENTPLLGAPVQRRMDTFAQQLDGAYGAAADRAASDGSAKPMTATAQDLLDPSVKGSLADYEPTAVAALKPEYDAIDSQASGVAVRPIRTLAFLDNTIAAQKAKFRGAKADWLPVIEDIRNDFADHPELPFATLREYRTSVRDELQQKLGDSWRNMAPAERRNVEGVLDGIYSNVTADIRQGLRVNGLRDAATKLDATDAEYAKVAETSKFLKPLLALPPEQLAPHLEQLAQDRGGNAGKLENVMKVLSPDQKANLQASFVHNLGLPNAGAATDRAFSADSFLTRWGGDSVRGGMSNDAKNLLFTGQTRRDLDDLAALTRAARTYNKRFGNPSGSGRIFAGVEEVRAGANAANAVIHGTLGVGTAMIEPLLFYSTAKLLASPGYARLLVNLGRKGSTYIPTAAKRLEYMARRTPGQATQLLGIRDMLLGKSRPGTVQTGTPGADPAADITADPTADPTNTGGMTFDAKGNLTGYTDADGQLYDANGNPIGGQKDQQTDNTDTADEQQ